MVHMTVKEFWKNEHIHRQLNWHQELVEIHTQTSIGNHLMGLQLAMRSIKLHFDLEFVFFFIEEWMSERFHKSKWTRMYEISTFVVLICFIYWHQNNKWSITNEWNNCVCSFCSLFLLYSNSTKLDSEIAAKQKKIERIELIETV